MHIDWEAIQFGAGFVGFTVLLILYAGFWAWLINDRNDTEYEPDELQW